MLAMLLSLACVHAPVVESVRHETYAVRGAEPAEIRRSLDGTRPEEYDGWTGWDLTWSWWVDCERRCRPTSVEVALDVRVVLPVLDGDDPPPEWTRYERALAAHEDRHLRITRAGARSLARALAQVRAGTFDDAKARMDALGERWLAEIHARNDRLDERTDHGRRRGASLGP